MASGATSIPSPSSAVVADNNDGDDILGIPRHLLLTTDGPTAPQDDELGK